MMVDGVGPRSIKATAANFSNNVIGLAEVSVADEIKKVQEKVDKAFNMMEEDFNKLVKRVEDLENPAQLSPFTVSHVDKKDVKIEGVNHPISKVTDINVSKTKKDST